MQLDWLRNELTEAASDQDIHGVVLTMSEPYKSPKTFIQGRTLHEKEELAELVQQLGFNTKALGKWLVMVSGGVGMLAYDDG